MEKRKSDIKTPRVNPGYAIFQISKALTTSSQHEDTETRERAQEKISKWLTVLDGIFSGSLDIGSRTPIKDVPAWATIEVVTGGFATGNLLAGGPLLEHEKEELAGISTAPEEDGRRILNSYYLSDEGLAKLRERLHTGCYDIEIPEEGALLTVAWLIDNGHAEEARSLLENLGPFFPRLRFYPIPTEQPRQFGTRIHLQDVGATIKSLQGIQPKRHILAQKEAIEIWTPLYDHTVQLFLETVEGDPPRVRLNPEGKRATQPNGRLVIEGGWPCQNYPEGWKSRAQKLLNEYDGLRAIHKLCGKPDRTKDSFSQLRELLARCLDKPSSLKGRDVGRIRLILARYITKHGTPESTQCRTFREKQAQQTAGPTFPEIAQVIIPRLEPYPRENGIDDIHNLIQPITSKEAQRSKIGADISIPATIQRKVQRCLNETAEVLVERGIITSGETLARVLPQMTSGIRAAGITDQALRRLYAAIYRAFRRRRSLLLLNLEKQARIEELPWVSAIDRFRHDDISTRESSRQALEEVSTLTLTFFPHVLIPNKLIQEMKALAKDAQLDLPLVEEIAADIFMGTFSGKYLKAAKVAANLLEGTLYAQYYGIDYRQVRKLPETNIEKKSWFGRKVIDHFTPLCAERAGVTLGGWDTVNNGMVIEQQQILTTQNLAALFSALDLADALRFRLAEMARGCFIFICRRHQMKIDLWHARLVMLKNTAYAWRQMIFYLSLLQDKDIHEFLIWADEHLGKQDAPFSTRFSPAINGLKLAIEGHSLDESEASRKGALRFLGWTKKKHWLLEQSR